MPVYRHIAASKPVPHIRSIGYRTRPDWVATNGNHVNGGQRQLLAPLRNPQGHPGPHDPPIRYRFDFWPYGFTFCGTTTVNILGGVPLEVKKRLAGVEFTRGLD